MRTKYVTTQISLRHLSTLASDSVRKILSECLIPTDGLRVVLLGSPPQAVHVLGPVAADAAARGAGSGGGQRVIPVF